MKKLLVTGISGFLGWHIAEHNQSGWQVNGIYQNNKPHHPEIQLNQLDLTDNQSVINYLQQYRPDAILHLAANSNPNDCEQNPLSNNINVKATIHLAKWCAKQDIPFVFTSTDLVFEGNNAPYAETDTTNPVMIYGKQKLEAEQKILQIYPQATIARMPLMYGMPSNGLGFMNAWMRNLKEGKNIYCFTDEYRTAASGSDAARGLFLLLEKKVNGIFHLGGKERLSRFEFATQMAEYFGLDKNLIITSLQKDVQMPAKRPADVSLNSNKAFTLGYKVNSLHQNLDFLI